MPPREPHHIDVTARLQTPEYAGAVPIRGNEISPEDFPQKFHDFLKLFLDGRIERLICHGTEL
jgi:hypothetical protein